MAITTMDTLLAGFQAPVFFEKVVTAFENTAIFHSLLYTAGIPGAGVANGQALAGAALTSYAGQLTYANPGAGNGYLARLSCNATGVGRLLICDRLWHNDSIAEATTTGQTINSAAWPARDANGSTNGEGVLVGIEVSTATTGGAVTNTTLTYTNSAGTGSRTATMAAFPSTAVAGVFVPFQLAAGDTGVRSIQTLTLGTTYGTGTIHLVAYRVLGEVFVTQANAGMSADAFQLGLPRMFDNTVPFLLWHPASNSGITIRGSYGYAHG